MCVAPKGVGSKVRKREVRQACSGHSLPAAQEGVNSRDKEVIGVNRE